jgi:uncharacterized membrane protein YbhN (UPF0104 family)
MIITPKHLIRFLLPWAFLIALLFFIFTTDSMNDILYAIKQMNPVFLFASLVLIIAY